MEDDILFKMCEDVKKWVNHTSEGFKRTEEDLKYFDRLWLFIHEIIIKIENKNGPLTEEEKDIMKIKYEGKLYRIHKKYNKGNKNNYGVEESIHYNSWTKTKKLADIHKVYEGHKYLIITANTSPDLFGIDLNRFNEYIQRNVYPTFTIGSPAILREQEVVFPILFSTIEKVEIKRVDD